ncbi:MAG: response regulator [Cellvibrionaceae bacterium]
MAHTAKKNRHSASISFTSEVAELSSRYITDDILNVGFANTLEIELNQASNNSENEKPQPPDQPLSGASQPTHKQSCIITPQLKNLRTLIVEDNPTDQLIIKNAAEELRLDITIAENAEDAINSLSSADKNHPFQLVIIDFKMPELDGLTASRYIREELDIQHIPKVILLSAFHRDEIFSKPNSYNCVNAFLTKPISPKTLSDALVDIMDHAKLHEDEWPVTHLNEPAKTTHSTEDNDELLAKCHILLAEDNLINQRVAAGILKLKGIRVTIANNGREAVDAINNAPPNEFDAVLMDIDMPILDGYEATSLIKQNPDSKGLPILALTAHNTPEDKEKCLGIGMSQYLTKPIKPETLYDSIVNSVKKSKND